MSHPVFREAYGYDLRRLYLVSFTMWQKVKPCGNGKMANRYRFKALTVSSHEPAHRQFGILVSVLSTSENSKAALFKSATYPWDWGGTRKVTLKMLVSILPD